MGKRKIEQDASFSEPKRHQSSESSDYDCQIAIDIRERVNVDGVTQSFVGYVKKNGHWEKGQLFAGTLPLGDIVIKSGENIRAVYERKTIADFVHSVNDNRFVEQRGRLLLAKQDAPGTIYGYIIEGEIEPKALGNHNARHIENLIWELGKFDFQVIRTKNYEQTTTFLCYMRRALAEHKTIGQAQSDAVLTMTNYSGRKKALNAENTLPQFLKLIDGVTPKHAIAIAERYGNLANLASKYKNTPRLLCGLVYGDNKKIGKIISEKIYKRIYGIVDGEIAPIEEQ